MRGAPGPAAQEATAAAPWRRVRFAVHALGVAAGWVLFVWGWHRVLARGADFEALQRLMFGAAVVVPVVTVWWILHNRGIHRRKGPRKAVPQAHLDYRTDFNGREVVADFAVLTYEQRVDVVIDGAHKRYHCGHGEDWRVQPAAEGAAAQAQRALEQLGHGRPARVGGAPQADSPAAP